MQNTDPFVVPHPRELASVVRAALGMALLMAGGVADSDVAWRQLMNLDRLAHQRLVELGVIEDGEDDRVSTREALMARIHLKMQMAVCLLHAHGLDDRLAELADETCMIQTQLFHMLMWEQDDREALRLN